MSEQHNDNPMPPPDTVITAQGLTKRYGKASAVHGLPRRGRRQIFQPIGNRSRMRPAANAFAMGVEQHEFDTNYAIFSQCLNPPLYVARPAPSHSAPLDARSPRG